MELRSIAKQALPLVCVLLVIAAVIPILFAVDGRVATRQPVRQDPPYRPPVTAADPRPSTPGQPNGTGSENGSASGSSASGGGSHQPSQPRQKKPFSWEWLKHVPTALGGIGLVLLLLKYGSLIPALVASLWPLWVTLAVIGVLGLILSGISSTIGESYVRPDPPCIQTMQ